MGGKGRPRTKCVICAAASSMAPSAILRQMTSRAKTRTRLREAARETATDLHRLGFIDKRKQQKLDALCLEPIPPYDSIADY